MFDSLGIDLVSLLWQIVAFGALILLLNMLLFKPLRKTLDERNRRIQESMEEAERVKEQAIRADEAYKERIEQAQQQAMRIQDETRATAQKEREEILEQARQEGQLLLEEARVQIGLERRDAARETQRQVAGLSVLAAGRLIGEALDVDKHRRMVEQYVAELDQPLAEMQTALADLSVEKVEGAKVRSAVPLTAETQAEIRAKLAKALGREMTVNFATDPKLIGGFVLQVGDQVVDLSVARKLNDLFRELAAV